MAGWRVWRLVDEERAGSRKGMLVMSVAPPGSRHLLHRHPNCEQVTYVLSGSGLHLTAGGATRQGAGEAAYVEPGEWHGFENDTDRPTTMIAVYGGVGDLGSAGYELHPSGITVPAEETRSEDGPARGGLPAPGVPASNTGVIWLVTSETCGADRVAVGAVRFGPGGRNERHSHPVADEILLVTEGGGSYLAEDGREVALREGELAYVPAGELHGYKAGPGATTSAVLAYLGTADPAEAGGKPWSSPRAP